MELGPFQRLALQIPGSILSPRLLGLDSCLLPLAPCWHSTLWIDASNSFLKLTYGVFVCGRGRDRLWVLSGLGLGTSTHGKTSVVPKAGPWEGAAVSAS